MIRNYIETPWKFSNSVCICDFFPAFSYTLVVIKSEIEILLIRFTANRLAFNVRAGYKTLAAAAVSSKFAKDFHRFATTQLHVLLAYSNDAQHSK